MLIFSYGSNMCFNRLRKRVPSAKPVATGFIEGYQMKCHKKSIDGSGKGTILKSESEEIVWGVIYDIDQTEKNLLDKAEGLNAGYNETFIEVKNGNASYNAQIYVADPDYLDPSLKAYHWYKAFILQGALENTLPENYINVLNKLLSITDPDPKRLKFNTSILNGEF